MNPPVVVADGCPDKEIAAETLKLKKAEDSERAGKLKEAFNAAKTVAWECLGNEAGKRREALMKRVGRTLGDQEEKQGRLKEAFGWYQASGLEADADRVMLKQANAKPDDTNASRWRHRLISRFVATMRHRVRSCADLPPVHLDKWLAAEEKAFAARVESRE
jgi:hypothetical protein